MKNLSQKLIVAALLFFCSNIQAEIYTWVDESGVKHYGDKIPARYEAQASNVEIDTHQPSAQDVKQAQERIDNWKKANQKL